MVIQLLQLIILQGLAGAVPDLNCSLHLSCHPDDLVPHPWDCHLYHVCLARGVPDFTTQRCPLGQYFDPTGRTCVQEESPCAPACPHPCHCDLLGRGRVVHDEHRCQQGRLLHMESNQCIDTSCLKFCSHKAGLAVTGTDTGAIASSKSLNRTIRECYFTCHGDFSTYADTSNCTRYYVCYPGNVGIPESCPADRPYYSGTYCTSDVTQCCAGQVKKHSDTDTASHQSTEKSFRKCYFICHGDFSAYADHSNCSKYYRCYPNGVGIPESCPPDRPYFNGVECISDSTQCCGQPPSSTETTGTSSTIKTPSIEPHTTTTTPSTQSSTTTTTTTTAPSVSCLLEPDCRDKPMGSAVPDPNNCLRYYVCLGDNIATEDSFPCQPGLYFNPETNKCHLIEGDTYLCLPPCTSMCSYSCLDSEWIFDPKNCSRYYLCYQGSTVHLSCSTSRPYFDGQACTAHPDSCCFYPCPPYCPYQGKMVPHGKDCHKYYICLDVGFPTNISLITCRNNEVFDHVTGQCSPTAECIQLCED
ncbi:uncharacterized protein [Panulirus ornatus]|uniref:uncharacterized protein n=1 Tax=Panulirus ornatus TaxID=150431 RepID=UPI003A850EF6